MAVSDWLGVAMYKGVLETVKQRLTLAWLRLVQQVERWRGRPGHCINTTSILRAPLPA